MEVKRCFRNTELGRLPDDWRVDLLGSLNPFVTSGSRGWARYYADTGAPFVRITNLSRSSIYLDLSDLKLVNLPAKDREGLRTQLQAGDLLVSITADIGVIGYVDGRVPQPAYINQHIALVRCDPTAADTKFLAYFLASGQPQRAFRAGTDQGAKAGMNLAGVLKIRAVFPGVPEQRAIAETLSDVDALLDGLDRLNVKKRNLKQAAMQQLLTGQTRLPGFRGKWEEKSFGALVDQVLPKSTLSSGDGQESGSFPLFVSGGEPKWTEVSQFCNAEALVFSDGGVFGVRRAVGWFSVTDHCFVVTLRRKLADMRWFESWFSLHSQQMDRLTFKGSGLRNLNKQALRAIEIRCPDVDEQTAIAEVLADMDAELAALEARRDKIRDLKQAMMQELLTGRTRLVKPEVAHA